MVQAETRWIRNTDKYAVSKNTIVNVFNIFWWRNGINCFQTIRESKLWRTVHLVTTLVLKEDDQYYAGYVDVKLISLKMRHLA
jgi:hypothetical protein